jgi:hypothetical protein
MNEEAFRTFWHGPRLTWIAQLCLSSFVARGHGVELFSYEPIDGVPNGVVIRDAAQILPCERLFLYRGGHAEISAPSLHSNLFRFKLLRDLGGWWIDADVLLLDGEIPKQVPVFGRGEDWVDAENKKRLGFGASVMRFPAGSEIMARAYAEATAMAAGNPVWATTGPYLFTRLVKELCLEHHALPRSTIYPLTYKEAYKFVRTEDREEIERRTDGAPFVHLFQHMLRLAGMSAKLPPEGSFLGNRCKSLASAGHAIRSADDCLASPSVGVVNLTSDQFIRSLPGGGDLRVIT